MTVAELIKELEKQPQDAEVVYEVGTQGRYSDDWDWDSYPVRRLQFFSHNYKQTDGTFVQRGKPTVTLTYRGD